MNYKNSYYFLILIILISLLMGACSAEKPPGDPTLSQEPAAPILEEPTETGEATDQPSVTPNTETPLPPGPERIQYQFLVELEYPNRVVYVDETILIPNPSSNPLDELVLIIPPNAWPDAFHLTDIQWLGTIPVADYSVEGVQLRIPLKEPWLPGETKELRILYRLDLPIQNAREGFGPSPFGYTDIQTNLVDWYPMVPPYQEGSGWIVHNPWLFGEYLVYPLADFQVTLDVENPSLVVAASTTGEKTGDRIHYQLDQARNFVFSISPDYQVLEGEVNGTTVLGYIFPPYRLPGQAAFEATMEALALYIEIFGPYLQPSLTMVQADFNHGMEYEGLYFQSRGFFDTYNGSEQSYLITIAVHETAHQWWYGQVANDQALEPWLDEALCTFSELLYYENHYPQAVNWWWGTRVNYYQPEGVINRSIYDYTEYVDQYLAYRNATYLRGAEFLADLREALGNEIFYDFIQNYAARFADQIATKEDFFTLLGEYVDVSSLEWMGEYFRE